MTLFGVMTVIFITLKVIGILDWSWLAVFSPLIIGAIINALAYMLITVYVNRF